MNAQSTIIGADGHIVEPPALWQEYVEVAFRDRETLAHHRLHLLRVQHRRRSDCVPELRFSFWT